MSFLLFPVMIILPKVIIPLLLHVACHGIIVNTTCGPVQGITSGDAFSFRGIPYAVPPTGDLRWRNPRKLSKEAGTCWSGTYRAIKYGNSCYQRIHYNHSVHTGSEDCLFLNVWTPTLNREAKKPVVVWIHGGSLQFSNANWPTYSPTEALAKDTDVVYVSMNYRLHAFGFMALQVLAEDSDTKTSGNYGLMDMVTALQWVQENIVNFGGDPNKVTVFGQSSGGTAILALISSPLCRGLFHRAYISSASAILNKTAADAFRDNEVILRNTGCDSVSCLRGLSSAEVTSAVPWDEYPYWAMSDQLDLPEKNYFDGAIIVVDGYLLRDAPFEAWRKGHMVDVPLLIGTTAQESDFVSVLDLESWDWEQYETHVRSKLDTFDGDIADTALKLYPSRVVSPRYQFTSMVSDLRVHCPIERLALTMAKYFTSPVFKYVATSEPSKPVSVFGLPGPAMYSFHIWDTFALFDAIKDLIKDPSESDLKFQAIVQTEVLSFVHTASPSNSSAWGPFPGTTALLSDRIQLVDAYRPEECRFWLDNGFFSYAWIN